jgi:TPR repeat protein
VRVLVALFVATVLASCDDAALQRVANDPCGIDEATLNTEASYTLRVCAALGDVEAQARLAMIYWANADNEYAVVELGLSADQLRTEGRRLMESAARAGNTEAQNELGLAHLDGDFGVPVDYERAFAWLTAADQRGDALASYNLARIYYAGYGRPRSEAFAERFLWRSAARGYQPAMCTLAALREQAPGEAEALRIAARAIDYPYACAADQSDLTREFR